MKITVFLIVFSVASVIANSGHSQETKLSVQLKDASLGKILNYIEDNSHYYFMYNNELVDLSRKVDIDVQNKSIGEILTVLFEKSGINYKIYNRQVVLSPQSQANSGFSFQQQTLKVSGKVTDPSGSPLPGVTVAIKNTTQGTITDANGNYSISNISGDATLVFSFVGMKTQEIAVAGETSINVTMTEETTSIDEVIAIGYGTQKRSSVTGAIATMEAEDIASIPVTKLSNALEGRISGVFVNNASGAPGYGASVRVRSINTWKNAGTEPLYVIDGIISTKQQFDVLDATEIKDVAVLKDAASAAVYGARGGNGVILITTNTGKEGKFKLSYNYSYSFDRPSNLPEYLDAKDMVSLSNYGRELDGSEPMYGPQEIAYFETHDPARAMFDEVYRDPTIQKHSISASGGGGRIKYFINGSSMEQTAFVKNADYKRYNLRSNINVDFTKNLSGAFNISYYQSQKDRFVMQEDNLSNFEVDDTFGKFWARLQFLQPFAPPRTSDGKLINPGWIGNALGFVEEGGMNHRTEYNINTVMSLTYKVPFVNGLSLSAKYSPGFYAKRIKHYEKKMTLYDVEKEGEHGLIYTDRVIGVTQSSYPSKEGLAKTSNINKNYQLNFSAIYQKTFEKHNVEAMFNIEATEGTDDYFYGVRENFPLLYKDQFWATGSSRADSYVGGSEYEWGRMSYIGRISYDYAEKYFLNATLRRDGSMLFAPDYRWGNFPSVSLGWVLSKEDFLGGSFFDFLKIRTTWGLAGNDAVGGWKWTESYNSNGTYLMGTSSVPRVVYGGIVNDKLTWEKTREFNIGFDSRLLGGLICNAEYFFRHSYDILDSRIVSLPASFGGNMPPVNYGIVDGRGFEIELGYNGRAGEVSYEVRGNLSYSTNKVVEKDIPENVRNVNNPIDRSTDYVAALVSNGIIRTQADLDKMPGDYTIYGLKPKLGDIWYEDVSGLEAGVPDGKIDDYDRQVIKGKHYLPPYTYGLNLNGKWKGFSVEVFFQGIIGVSKMWAQDYGSRAYNMDGRSASVWLDSWSNDNPNGSFPRPAGWGQAKNDLESTFWLRNADYLRLKNVSLSYSIPRSVINKLKVSDITLMVSGVNLLTLSKFNDYDPNVWSMGSYPTMKTYTLGVNVTF